MRLDAVQIHRVKNALQSALLIVVMTSIAAACAWTLWGGVGVVWAFGSVALIMALSPAIPPHFVMSWYRARPLMEVEFPEGYAIVAKLTQRADLPSRPRLYYLASSTLNAFAVGSPTSAAIGLTDGLLRRLDHRELAGVLAHEISHIRHNDLWVMTLADVMGRVTSWFSYFGVFLLALNLPLVLAGVAVVPWLLVWLLIFAPTLIGLLQLALSRAREFDADLSAAELTGDPTGLAAALAKLERYQGGLWEALACPRQRVPEASLLRTHPSAEARIRRLLELTRPARSVAPRHRHAPPRVQTPAPRRWPVCNIAARYESP